MASLPVEPAPFVQDENLIPYTAGRITDAKYYGSDTVVINIQDLHCHGEVQRNIARILEALDISCELSAVHVEGGIGKLDTSWASLIPEPKQREKMLGILLDSGRLTGAEYYAIRTGRNNLLLGLENEKPYYENLIRLREITETRNSNAALLPDIRQHIALLKKRYFSARNQRLETLIEEKKEGEAYYRALARYAEKAGVDLYEYPDIRDYLSVIQMQKRLNHKRIARELSGCLSSLKNKLPYSAYRELAARTDNFSRADDLCVQLLLLTQERNIPVGTQFPALGKYFSLIEAIRRINPIELVREERQLVRELRTICSESGAEKEVVFMAGYTEYLEDYFDGKIAADNYRYFTVNSPRFISLWKKYISLSDLPDLEPENGLLKDFYRVNIDRNSYFLQNLFTSAPPVCGTAEYRGTDHLQKILGSLGSAHIATVVTGGFHTPGFLALLRKKKISYIVITPSVTSDTSFSDKAYDRIALEQGETIPTQTISPEYYTGVLRKLTSAESIADRLFRDIIVGALRLAIEKESKSPEEAVREINGKDLGGTLHYIGQDRQGDKDIYVFVHAKGRFKLEIERKKSEPGVFSDKSLLLKTVLAVLLPSLFITLALASGHLNFHALPGIHNLPSLFDIKALPLWYSPFALSGIIKRYRNPYKVKKTNKDRETPLSSSAELLNTLKKKLSPGDLNWLSKRLPKLYEKSPVHEKEYIFDQILEHRSNFSSAKDILDLLSLINASAEQRRRLEEALARDDVRIITGNTQETPLSDSDELLNTMKSELASGDLNLLFRRLSKLYANSNESRKEYIFGLILENRHNFKSAQDIFELLLSINATLPQKQSMASQLLSDAIGDASRGSFLADAKILLHSENSENRIIGAMVIGLLGSADNIPSLTSLLNGSWNMRDTALKALFEMKNRGVDIHRDNKLWEAVHPDYWRLLLLNTEIIAQIFPLNEYAKEPISKNDARNVAVELQRSQNPERDALLFQLFKSYDNSKNRDLIADAVIDAMSSDKYDNSYNRNTTTDVTVINDTSLSKYDRTLFLLSKLSASTSKYERIAWIGFKYGNPDIQARALSLFNEMQFKGGDLRQRSLEAAHKLLETPEYAIIALETIGKAGDPSDINLILASISKNESALAPGLSTLEDLTQNTDIHSGYEAQARVAGIISPEENTRIFNGILENRRNFGSVQNVFELLARINATAEQKLTMAQALLSDAIVDSSRKSRLENVTTLYLSPGNFEHRMIAASILGIQGSFSEIKFLRNWLVTSMPLSELALKALQEMKDRGVPIEDDPQLIETVRKQYSRLLLRYPILTSQLFPMDKYAAASPKPITFEAAHPVATTLLSSDHNNELITFLLHYDNRSRDAVAKALVHSLTPANYDKVLLLLSMISASESDREEAALRTLQISMRAQDSALTVLNRIDVTAAHSRQLMRTAALKLLNSPTYANTALETLIKTGEPDDSNSILDYLNKTPGKIIPGMAVLAGILARSGANSPEIPEDMIKTLLKVRDVAVQSDPRLIEAVQRDYWKLLLNHAILTARVFPVNEYANAPISEEDANAVANALMKSDSENTLIPVLRDYKSSDDNRDRIADALINSMSRLNYKQALPSLSALSASRQKGKAILFMLNSDIPLSRALALAALNNENALPEGITPDKMNSVARKLLIYPQHRNIALETLQKTGDPADTELIAAYMTQDIKVKNPGWALTKDKEILSSPSKTLLFLLAPAVLFTILFMAGHGQHEAASSLHASAVAISLFVAPKSTRYSRMKKRSVTVKTLLEEMKHPDDSFLDRLSSLIESGAITRQEQNDLIVKIHPTIYNYGTVLYALELLNASPELILQTADELLTMDSSGAKVTALRFLDERGKSDQHMIDAAKYLLKNRSPHNFRIAGIRTLERIGKPEDEEMIDLITAQLTDRRMYLTVFGALSKLTSRKSDFVLDETQRKLLTAAALDIVNPEVYLRDWKSQKKRSFLDAVLPLLGTAEVDEKLVNAFGLFATDRRFINDIDAQERAVAALKATGSPGAINSLGEFLNSAQPSVVNDSFFALRDIDPANIQKHREAALLTLDGLKGEIEQEISEPGIIARRHEVLETKLEFIEKSISTIEEPSSAATRSVRADHRHSRTWHINMSKKQSSLTASLSILLPAAAITSFLLNGPAHIALPALLPAAHANAAFFLQHLSFAHYQQAIPGLAYLLTLPVALGSMIIGKQAKPVVSDATISGWKKAIPNADAQFFIYLNKTLRESEQLPEPVRRSLIAALVPRSNPYNFVFLYAILLKLNAAQLQKEKAIANMLPAGQEIPVIPDEVKGNPFSAMIRTAALFFNQLAQEGKITEQYRNTIIYGLIDKGMNESNYFNIFKFLKELKATDSEQIGLALFLLKVPYVELQLAGLEELYARKITVNSSVQSAERFVLGYPFAIVYDRFAIMAKRGILPDLLRKKVLHNIKLRILPDNYKSILNLIRILRPEEETDEYALELLKFDQISSGMLIEIETALLHHLNRLTADPTNADRISNATPGMRFVELGIIDEDTLLSIRNAAKNIIETAEPRNRNAGFRALDEFATQDDVNDLISYLENRDKILPALIVLGTLARHNAFIPDSPLIKTALLDLLNAGKYVNYPKGTRALLFQILPLTHLSAEEMIAALYDFVDIKNDPEAHARAIQALSDTGSPKAVEPLKEFLAKAETVSNAYNSFLALQKLDSAFLQNPANQSMVISVFKRYAGENMNHQAQLIALDVLQQIHSEDSINALSLFLLQNNSAPILNEAYMALKQQEDDPRFLRTFHDKTVKLVQWQLKYLQQQEERHKDVGEQLKATKDILDKLNAETLPEIPKAPLPAATTSGIKRMPATLSADTVIMIISDGRSNFAEQFNRVWLNIADGTQREAMFDALMTRLPSGDTLFIDNLKQLGNKPLFSNKNKDRIRKAISGLNDTDLARTYVAALKLQMEVVPSPTSRAADNQEAVGALIKEMSTTHNGFSGQFVNLWLKRTSTQTDREVLLSALVRRISREDERSLKELLIHFFPGITFNAEQAESIAIALNDRMPTGNSAFRQWLNDLPDADRAAALEGLAELRLIDDKLRPIILKYLNSNNPDLMRIGLQAITRIARKEDIPRIVALLDDADRITDLRKRNLLKLSVLHGLSILQQDSGLAINDEYRKKMQDAADNLLETDNLLSLKFKHRRSVVNTILHFNLLPQEELSARFTRLLKDKRDNVLDMAAQLLKILTYRNVTMKEVSTVVEEGLQSTVPSPAINTAGRATNATQNRSPLSIAPELRHRSYFRFARELTPKLMQELDKLAESDLDTFFIVPAQGSAVEAGVDLSEEYGHVTMKTGDDIQYLNVTAIRKGHATILLFKPAGTLESDEHIFANADPFAAVAQMVSDNLRLRKEFLGAKGKDFSVDLIEADNDIYGHGISRDTVDKYPAMAQALFFSALPTAAYRDEDDASASAMKEKITAEYEDAAKKKPGAFNDSLAAKHYSAIFTNEPLEERLQVMSRAQRMEQLKNSYSETAPLLSQKIDLKSFDNALFRLEKTDYFKEQALTGVDTFILDNLPSDKTVLKPILEKAREAKVRIVFDYNVSGAKKDARSEILSFLNQGFNGYRLRYDGDEPENIGTWLPDLIIETYKYNADAVIALPYNGKRGSDTLEALAEQYELYRLMLVEPEKRLQGEPPQKAWIEMDSKQYQDDDQGKKDFVDDLTYVMSLKGASVVGMDSAIYAQGEHRFFNGITDFMEFFIQLFETRIAQRNEDPDFRYENGRNEGLRLTGKSVPILTKTQRGQLLDMLINYRSLAGKWTEEQRKESQQQPSVMSGGGTDLDKALSDTVKSLRALVPASTSSLQKDDVFNLLRELYNHADLQNSSASTDKKLLVLATAAGFAYGLLEQDVRNFIGRDIQFASQTHEGIYRRAVVEAEIIMKTNTLTEAVIKGNDEEKDKVFKRFYEPLTKTLYEKSGLRKDGDVAALVHALNVRAADGITTGADLSTASIPVINQLYSYTRHGKQGNRSVAIAELLRILELYAEKKSVIDPRNIENSAKEAIPEILGLKGIRAAA